MFNEMCLYNYALIQCYVYVTVYNIILYAKSNHRKINQLLFPTDKSYIIIVSQ
ncbi:hypothetical protein RchiOBHm_Chr1g0336451 [Rosa chinensis]|uniref:Uncharacterized protein n=1 Tax=Rosa chinensis TaxID=74649 RepID=A0A2P6SCN4_ROSCH|nr:hypothetical protein RchiOBHm_Chr1g0336451 [Rosa chinensis]